MLGNTLPIENLFKLKLLLYAHASYNYSPSLPTCFHLNHVTNNQIHSHNTRNKNDFHIKLSTSNFGFKATNALSFRLWNSLPADLKVIHSIVLFKKMTINNLWQCENLTGS